MNSEGTNLFEVEFPKFKYNIAWGVSLFRVNCIDIFGASLYFKIGFDGL